MRDVFGAGSFAVLSAERAGLSVVENDARTVALRAVVESLGFEFEGVKGVWEGTREAAFIVRGIAPEDAVRLGDVFGQDAVITSDGLTVGGVTYPLVLARYGTQVEDATEYFETFDGLRVALEFAAAVRVAA